MKTIKLSTIVDRARLKGVGYADDYMDVELLITGVGLEKDASVSDMVNPSGVFLNICVSRKDRKSTRLNSSHQIISYAVFCLKKKNNTYNMIPY